jgi:hypothetical protein
MKGDIDMNQLWRRYGVRTFLAIGLAAGYPLSAFADGGGQYSPESQSQSQSQTQAQSKEELKSQAKESQLQSKEELKSQQNQQQQGVKDIIADSTGVMIRVPIVNGAVDVDAAQLRVIVGGQMSPGDDAASVDNVWENGIDVSNVPEVGASENGAVLEQPAFDSWRWRRHFRRAYWNSWYYGLRPIYYPYYRGYYPYGYGYGYGYSPYCYGRPYGYYSPYAYSYYYPRIYCN